MFLMDFNIIFQRFAEQSPIVVTLGVVIYYLFKMLKDEQKCCKLERKEHKEEIKELNTYVREREQEHIETLNNLIIIIESTNEKIDNLKIQKND